MKYELKKNRWKPGDVVIRFGNWRKGEPTVIIDSRKWNSLGNPEAATVEFRDGEEND